MTLTTLRLSERNLTVSCRDHGTGDPLVLLHGVGMQSAAWTPQIEALAQCYRVIAPDLPGHGGSDPLPADSPLQEYVSWCSDVIRALGLGAVNLAGHSMGALIAAGVAVTYPDKICRVALLNGVYRRDADASAAVIARAREIRAGQIDLETPLERWFTDASNDAHPRALVKDWLNEVNVEGYATAYGAFAKGDATYADQLSGLTCPFLALTGDGDQNSTPAMSQLMSETVQNGQCVVIAGHRHMVNLTAAAEVNAHLRAWLSQPALAKEAQ